MRRGLTRGMCRRRRPHCRILIARKKKNSTIRVTAKLGGATLTEKKPGGIGPPGIPSFGGI